MQDTLELPRQEPALSSEQRFLKLVAQVAVCAFLVVLFLYGICISGVVLKEPDICFLLGGGRWIIEHGQLPLSDPFSYTTHLHPLKYVIEKWLSEVIFYSIESSCGLIPLLLFDGIVLALAFVIIPFRIAYLCGLRGGGAMGMVVLGLLTSCTHLALRAEVFSFLFSAIWLEVMVRLSIATAGNAKIKWNYVALLAVLSCLWSNMHTLFMLAILIPGFYTVCALIERVLPHLKKNPFNWTAPIITCACALASLINPYGIGLWYYIPNIFGAFTQTNNEMQPINLQNFAGPFFFPFYFLIFISLRSLLKSFREPLKPGDLFFRGLIPLGIIGGFKTVRSIPIAGCFLLSGKAKLTDEKVRVAALLPDAIESILTAATNPFHFGWVTKCVGAVSLGVYVCTFSVIPQVPQMSAAFKPPFTAIEFIENHRPSGNLLNDPHFGAVMIYKMRENPLVFIDPRYNLYGNVLLQDYWHMVNCDPNCNQLLQQYRINWIFLSPQANLPKMLATNPEWQLLYSDTGSVIYARRIAITQAIQ